MKKYLLLAAFVVFGLFTFAQNAEPVRKIEVTGTAEEEVTPDIITVSISLKEYHMGKVTVSISKLEGQLENAVKEAGIAKEDFTIDGLGAYNRDYFNEKKDPQFLASKQFYIRFSNLDKFNQIISKLDPKGIESTNIEDYDYSRTIEKKRELQIKALLAAKEKASYLLNSIGEKLGSIISISEIDNNFSGNMYANSFKAYKSTAPSSDINFKKMKLSFSINAVFEIVK